MMSTQSTQSMKSTKSTNRANQILIIGSGVGGLSAGIILAKLGYPVTIVEKNTMPGGLMGSYVRNGIACPVGVHYMGTLDHGQPLRRCWDYLGVSPLIPLERMGADGVIDRYLFDDFAFDLPEGIDAFEDRLKEACPLEHGSITTITAELRHISRSLTSLDMLTSPEMIFLSPESFQSMGEYLLPLHCSPRLISILAVPSRLIGVPLWECPVFYYLMTLASYLQSAWRLACSGTQMADAFVSRFTSLGGQMATGDGVEKILVESGKVKGVALQSGRVLEGTAVIAAVHPATVTAMLPAGALRPALAERIAHLENTKGILAVNLAVDADAHGALPYNIYRLSANEDGSLASGMFYQLLKSDKPGVNLLSMMTESGIEEWRQWEGTQSGRRGDDYTAAKEEKARQFIKEASELFGPFKDVKILDIFTPLTIRDHVGSPQGSCYGILRSTRQMMKTASLNRTSVEGLFLAGQNSMAPGIMGTVLGSFQTVRRFIGQARFEKEVMEDF